MLDCHQARVRRVWSVCPTGFPSNRIFQCFCPTLTVQLQESWTDSVQLRFWVGQNSNQKIWQFLGIWALGCLGVWEPERLGIWASGNLGIWASGNLGFWESGGLGIWASGYLGIWVTGHLGIWAYGYLGIWASGHLGIWASGHLGIIICSFEQIPMWAFFSGCPYWKMLKVS